MPIQFTVLLGALNALVMPTSTGDGSAAGLVAHISADGATYYRLAVGRFDNGTEWRLDRVVAGKPTVLARGPASFVAGKPIALRLDIVGEYHIAYVDGGLVAQVSDWPDWQDNNWKAYGPSGIWASGAAVRFDRIAAASYDPAE